MIVQLRGERIKQVDKIEKLILRRKGRRWRHLALLGFVLVVDLLDLPTVDTQATGGQDVLGHLVPQALEQRLGRLLRLQGEGQGDHLGHFKETFAKAEAIRVQLGLHGGLRKPEAHGVMSQVESVELLAYPFRGLGA